MKKILTITDNESLLERWLKLIESKKIDDFQFDYIFSPKNDTFKKKYKGVDWIKPLRIKDNADEIIKKYDMIFSLHCKQIFPDKLVDNIKCINIHPGLNPYNRGWFPQVFSIINDLPIGATIHEIDKQLDHGKIICQKEVYIDSWDTSLSLYEKILDAEMELLDKNIEIILSGDYKAKQNKEEGNINLKKDFDDLCKLNLKEKDTWKNHINMLRALSHGKYKNAYFIDELGNKIFIKIDINKED